MSFVGEIHAIMGEIYLHSNFKCLMGEKALLQRDGRDARCKDEKVATDMSVFLLLFCKCPKDIWRIL